MKIFKSFLLTLIFISTDYSLINAVDWFTCPSGVKKNLNELTLDQKEYIAADLVLQFFTALENYISKRTQLSIQAGIYKDAYKGQAHKVESIKRDITEQKKIIEQQLSKLGATQNRRAISSNQAIARYYLSQFCQKLTPFDDYLKKTSILSNVNDLRTQLSKMIDIFYVKSEYGLFIKDLQAADKYWLPTREVLKALLD